MLVTRVKTSKVHENSFRWGKRAVHRERGLRVKTINLRPAIYRCRLNTHSTSEHRAVRMKKHSLRLRQTSRDDGKVFKATGVPEHDQSNIVELSSVREANVRG